MSKQKEGGIGTGSSVVVGGNQKHRKLPAKLATWMFVLPLLVLLVVGYLIFRHYNGSSNDAVTTTPAYDSALKQSFDGNPGPLQTQLDLQLAKAKSSEQKVEIYNNKMNAAFNAKQYSGAIAFGNSAEKIKQTSDTAQIMSQIYAASGDKALAKQWLQKAIDRLDKTQSAYDRTLRDLQAQMTGLDQ